VLGLISLGWVLSLDNFRSSLVLGGLRPTFRLDLVTGVCFVLIAVLMALGVTLPLAGD
jgi:putative Mn2+ efflux pump MntP